MIYIFIYIMSLNQNKKIVATVKLNLRAGKANIGDRPTKTENISNIPATLGRTGVDGRKFCDYFNEETKHLKDKFEGLINVKVYVYSDKSYIMEYANKPTITNLVKKILGKTLIKTENNEKIIFFKSQVMQIAEEKFADLNVKSIEKAYNIVKGSLSSMSIIVKDE